jgi:hypothetical protein
MSVRWSHAGLLRARLQAASFLERSQLRGRFGVKVPCRDFAFFISSEGEEETMGRAACSARSAVWRLIRRKVVRSLLVILLGGVVVTLVVRAVEGSETGNPVDVYAQVDAYDGYGPSGGGYDTPAPRVGNGMQVSQPGYVASLDRASAEASGVDAAFMRSAYMKDILRYSPDSASGIPLFQFATRPRRWARVLLPDDVKEVLHGADAYVVTGAGNGRELVALRNTSVYVLPGDLTPLLADAGVVFGRRNAPEWMNTFAFFIIAARRLGLDFAYEEVDPRSPSSSMAEALKDSILDARAPLVPDFSVSQLAVTTATESDPGRLLMTPSGAVSRVTAVVQWGQQRERVAVDLVGTAEFDDRSFPYQWDGIFPTFFVLPMGPGLDQNYYEFYIDQGLSSETYLETYRRGLIPPYWYDSCWYAVVVGNGQPLNPRIEFRVEGLAEEYRENARVLLWPLNEHRSVPGSNSALKVFKSTATMLGYTCNPSIRTALARIYSALSLKWMNKATGNSKTSGLPTRTCRVDGLRHLHTRMAVGGTSLLAVDSF